MFPLLWKYWLIYCWSPFWGQGWAQLWRQQHYIYMWKCMRIWMITHIHDENYYSWLYTPDENVDDKTQDYNVDDDTSDENVNKNSHDDNTSNDNVDDGDKGDDNRHWAAATVKVRQGSFKPVGWSNFPACLVSSTIRCLEEEEGEVEVHKEGENGEGTEGKSLHWLVIRRHWSLALTHSLTNTLT